MRSEHDLLGIREVKDDVLYGIQTLRAMENFNITGEKLDKDFIVSLGYIKKSSAICNIQIKRLDEKIGNALIKASDEIINGMHHEYIVVDPIQGGDGTSINMNINEVITNRSLLLIGEKMGNYDIISPNNHANMAQSTNDVVPTGIKLCSLIKSKKLIESLTNLQLELLNKSIEFNDILKMGRTHLQDAVPITLGQEMASYASSINRAIERIKDTSLKMETINMGGTAIGTGLNANLEYIKLYPNILSKETGFNFKTATNLIDATNNTDPFADMSSALKNTALVLIKMCNDFRLMASGPKCGFNELLLPPRQPGSSIMPGKVNPVIAEVLNQACYQVIGNDLTISLAVENGQFELNVMEPILAFNLFKSFNYLTNAINTFTDKLLKGLNANRERCTFYLHNGIGIVTALLPHIGYSLCSDIAKESLKTGKSVKEIVLERNLITKEKLDKILEPESMTKPGITGEDIIN